MIKYYNENDVDACISNLLTLKSQAVIGMDSTAVLEKSKPVLLELIEAKIPVKTIVKHYHDNNVNISAIIIGKYLASIRPKAKTRRKKVANTKQVAISRELDSLENINNEIKE